MAETMIERVAKALIAVPDQSGLTVHDCALVLARAAIAAMREPTKAMAKAGYDEGRFECWADVRDGSAQLTDDAPRTIWESMIDAAVAEPKEVG